MIKALIFDLDGTLLTGQKQIAESSREALKRCREKGIRVFVATARAPMLDKMFGWGPETMALFDGGIFCNGSCEKVGEEAFYHYIDAEAVRVCLEEAAQYPGLQIALHLTGDLHAFNHHLPDELLGPWGLERREALQILDLPDADVAGQTIKILLYHNYLIGNRQLLPEGLFETLRVRCAGRAALHLLDKGKTIQVGPLGVDKVSGIEKVRCTLELQPDEIAVFGDDFNDLDMLRTYPNSVAMGNAE
ncbi:MAG: HAD-IIB family hydrolase, partial [Firmicutes bacterium]|nr:HAD-IIB family hydrolase [Bacillota bacterium]